MLKNSLSQGFSTIVIVIIAAIVLLGGGAYFLTRDSASDRASSESASESVGIEDSVEVEGGTTSTLPDVIGRGQSLECDWKMPVEAEDNPFGNGKLYTNGSKGRSMITANINGAQMEANAIYMNNEVYSWMSVAGNTFGFKFDEETLESEAADMTPQEREQAEQIKAEMIIDCRPWTPDNSLFELPTGVDFN